MERLWSRAALVGLTLAASCGTARATPRNDACRMVKVAELPVKFEHNRPLVPVAFNGKPAWLLIDTGSADTVLFGGAARTLGIGSTTAEGVRFFGVGGGRQANLAVVRDLQIAGVKVKDIRMFVIGAEGTTDFAGLIGRDLLGNWDIEFDLASKAVRLWTPLNCESRSLGYWAKDPELAEIDRDDASDEYRVRVRLNGKPFEATFDSGAGTSIVTREMAVSAGVSDKDYESDVTYSRGIGAANVPTRTVVFNEVQVGDETVNHAKLQVADMFAADTELRTGSILKRPVEGLRNPPMLLGADFLRSHRVLLSGSQRRLYFTYSGGPVFQSVGDAASRKESGPAVPGG